VINPEGETNQPTNSNNWKQHKMYAVTKKKFFYSVGS